MLLEAGVFQKLEFSPTWWSVCNLVISFLQACSLARPGRNPAGMQRNNIAMSFWRHNDVIASCPLRIVSHYYDMWLILWKEKKNKRTLFVWQGHRHSNPWDLEMDADTVILGTLDLDMDADTVILGTLDLEMDADTVILGALDLEMDADTVILGTLNLEMDADTLILGTLNLEMDADTVILGTLDLEMDADTVILGALDLEMDADTVILGTLDLEMDADTVILGTLDLEMDADIVILGALDLEMDKDTVILGTLDLEMDTMLHGNVSILAVLGTDNDLKIIVAIFTSFCTHWGWGMGSKKQLHLAGPPNN